MKTYDELLAERDALAAKLSNVIAAWNGHDYDAINAEINKTSQQCLAEIRAEAVENFAKALSSTVQIPNGPITRVDYYKAAIRHAIQFAEQYAAKVRQGGE